MTSQLKTFALSSVLAACAVLATNTAALAAPQKSGPTAPEFTGISQWLNSEPLKLQQLRGKVVLVDFWTYSCINCANTLPYVKSWNQKYKDQGLTVIGVHTPEYPFERDTGNVKTALKRLGISYPVAQDNRFATWNAYNNQYWPAFYLIDKQGQIVYTHFGEGDYAQTEAEIQALLAQKN
jgi:thiol-disulfide isomerase/thioredoxin